MSPSRTLKKHVILLIALMLMFLAPTALNAICLEDSAHEVTLPIPAVAQSGKESFGVISYLTVRVVPGSGHVYIETWPLAEVDMQASARIAAHIAFEIANKYKDLGSFDSWDYLYSVRSNSPIMGGPSAGAAMTIATIGALLEIKPKPGIIITGMINPDGTIGAVGGILEKIDAAASINATIFLLPYGQLYVNKTVMEKYTIGPFIYYKTKTVTVNVRKYALEKYGIRVHEVLTIYDALKYFYESLPVSDTISYIDMYRSALTFHYVNSFLKNSSILALNHTQEYLNTTLSKMDALSRIFYRDDIEKAQYLIQKARELINDKLYYSALSLLFQANTTITYMYNMMEYSTQGDRYIEDLTRELNNTIDFLKSILVRSNLTDGMIAAQIRVIDAVDSLEKAGEYYKEGDIYNAIRELSYAEERLKTAFLWINFSGSLFSSDSIRDSFDDELSFATLLYAYIYSMYGSHYADQVLRYIELSEKAYAMKFYGGAYLYALEARAHAESFLDILGISSSDLLNKIAYVRYETMREINISLNNKSIIPLLALAYFEYSYYFENKENDLELAFVFTKLAKSWITAYMKFGTATYGNITLNNITLHTPKENSSSNEPNGESVGESSGDRLEIRAIIVAIVMFAIFLLTVYLMRRD